MSRPAPTLRNRLLLGNVTLIVAALAITWAVATIAGPPLFRDHIQHRGTLPTGFLDRAEQAFHVANLLEFVFASVLALTFTFIASLFVSRAVSVRIGEMTALTADIAAGHYSTRLPRRRTSRELDALTIAVNDLASRLQRTEATRRRLLTDLAHELRTPIATIDGYLEAIEDGIETADDETLHLLRRQVRRLTRLADDLQAVSAADENRLRIERSPVRIAELSRHLIRGARPDFTAKGVELQLVLTSDVTVVADATRLEQVLTNVLANSLRHTRAGGQVSLLVSASGNQVTLTVTDTGEGIDRAHLPHLFERFYRGHRRDDQQGSGVGLTISRAIVAAHGGTITVESAGLGHGTTVTISLPLATGRTG